MPTRPDPTTTTPTSCTWVAERIEAYLDDDLGAGEGARLEAHSAACPRCTEELEGARTALAALRRLPALTCPPAVTAAVMRQAEREAAARNSGGPIPWWRRAAERLRRAAGKWLPRAGTPAWRPALATALALAVVAGALLLPRLTPEPQVAAGMTAEELARTELEVKLAFAYITQMGRRAGGTVSEEVVENVILPARSALGGAPAGAGARRDGGGGSHGRAL